MSIASELNNYRNGLEDAYDAVSDMSGTIPTDRNMNNLDDAIRTIPISSPNDGVLTITQNGTTVQTFSANQASNATAALTDTTYTAGNGIGIANDTISVDTSVVATQTDLGNYVTLSTNQNITGEKTFVGNKRIKFKGTASNSKCGFTSFDQNNGETGFLEVEGTSTGSKKVRLGCYDNASGGSNRDNYVGFQYYNTKASGGTVSYNLICPPRYRGVSGTNAFAYIPVDFTDGNTTIRADNTGILNLSTLLPSYSGFTGATSSTAGAEGLVPAPAAGDEDKVLTGAGTWAKVGNDNIGWGTMEHWTITLSGNQTVSQTTAYNYVDVPGGSVTATMEVGGVYLVLLNASVRCNDGSTDVYARVLANGGQAAVGVAQNQAAGTFATVTSAQLFTAAQASNTFKLQIGGGRANSDYMIAGDLISSVQIMRIA